MPPVVSRYNSAGITEQSSAALLVVGSQDSLLGIWAHPAFMVFPSLMDYDPLNTPFLIDIPQYRSHNPDRRAGLTHELHFQAAPHSGDGMAKQINCSPPTRSESSRSPRTQMVNGPKASPDAVGGDDRAQSGSGPVPARQRTRCAGR
jgi:hypothetical protein